MELRSVGAASVGAHPRAAPRFPTRGGSYLQLAYFAAVPRRKTRPARRGRRGITADTALRLARYLGTSAELWLGLQLEYDLRTARQTLQREIDKVVKPRSAAA